MSTTTPTKSPRTRHFFPANLTDLNRFRKSVHGHDGSSRIVMVRKTDQRTFASIKNGEEPKLETITRETIETFCGQRTEYKVTTEKKDEQKSTEDLIIALVDRNRKSVGNGIIRKKPNTMEFEMQCLKAHNDHRQNHGVPPLKLNREMCKHSQDWANNLISKEVLFHSSNNKYGENIYCVSSTVPNISVAGDEPAKKWYQEIDKHVFGVEPKTLDSGHFTQIVWKETRELGVAYAKLNKRIIVVANYYPPGNIVGSYAENVPPFGGFANDNNNIIDDLSKLSLSPRSANGALKKKYIGTEGDFEEDFLNAHNEYRRRHGVPPLRLDKKLCKISEEWAKILASRSILQHRKNCPYGENIYSMYSSDPSFLITGHTPVDSWYEEVTQHHFGREPTNLKTGHFTQVIWKSSETLGVGVAKSRHGYIYIVANYSPAGNFVGEYTENVPPLLESSVLNASASESVADKSIRHIIRDFSDFEVDCLKVHNEYRRRHGVPPLKLSKQLTEYAREWAEQCAKSKNMAHRPSNGYGENIFCMYSSDFSHVPSARDVIKKWYDEIEDHTFGVEKINHGTLHFTQIVWKNTIELGIAMARNDKGLTYIVANYNPRGNILGQFAANVPKPRA